MSDRVEVQLTARDNMSPAFAKVTSGLDRFEQRLQSAEKSTSRFSRTGAAFGAAIGALSGIMADAARASAEAEISNVRLQSSIEATGRTIDEFADQLEAAGEAAVQMGFDDEDAADAISFLTQATGDAQTAINDLQLVMDIARGRGISLADSARLVAAAEQERFTALRRVGIVLDENASKEEAIAALQGKFAGQAQAYSETTVGMYDRISVKLGNLQEDLGAHAGALQSIMVLLPGLSVAWTGAAAAVGGLATALGPAGLALVAGGLAAGALLKLSGIMGNDIPDASQEAVAAIGSLQDVLASMAEQGDLTGTRALLAVSLQMTDEMVTANNALLDQANAGMETFLQETINTIDQWGETVTLASGEVVAGLSVTDQVLEGLTDTERAWIDVNSDGLVTLDELTNRLDGYSESVTHADEVNQALETSASGMTDILQAQGKGASEAQINLIRWLSALNNGKMSGPEFVAKVEAQVTALNDQAIAAALATGAVNQLSIAEENWNIVSVESALAMAQLQPGLLQYILNQQNAEIATRAAAAQTRIITENWNTMSVEAALAAAEVQALADAQDGLVAAFEAVTSAYTATSEALSSGFQVAVTNTNAIASQSEAVNDWAMELVNVRGTLGEIDKIYQQGSPQWEAAQQAQESIAASNERIQRSILKIQADQIPVVADLLNEQEDYWQAVAHSSAEQQTLALAYADSATSAQALQLAQSYIADQDTFGPMLLQLAEANPYLEAILRDMGILDETKAEPTLDPDFEAGQSEIGMLTDAITHLDETLWMIHLGIEDGASGTLTYVQGLLNDINGQVATATVITNYVPGTGLSGIGSGPSGLGGVAGYAGGGVVAEMAEWGPEMLHFPNGGVAIAATPGLYNVPMGTYVDTAPATAAKTGNWGGITVNVHIEHANNVEDIAREIGPAIQRAVAIQRRSWA